METQETPAVEPVIETVSTPETFTIDFETYYDDEYSVQGSTYWAYTNDPKFDAYLVSIIGPGVQFVGHPSQAPWGLLNNQHLVAHNAGFDDAVFRRLVELKRIPAITPAGVSCSLDLCAYHQMPRGLARAAKEVLDLEVSKDMRNWMKGRTWESVAPDRKKMMMDYALRDSEVANQIWRKLSPTWPTHERRLSFLTRQSGNAGLHIDVSGLDRAIELLSLALWNLGKMMPWFTSSDVKPLSLIYIREQGRIDKIEVPGSLDMRNEDAIKWEERYAPQFAWVRAIRGYRRVNALLKKLQTLKRMLRPDGTAPYTLKYGGAAATLRWSGDGGFNMQNIPKFPIAVCKSCWGCNFDDGETLAEAEDEAVDVCPFCKSKDLEFVDLRSLITSAPGKTLIVSDYAQVEARILLWLVNDKETLELIRKGMSVYEAHARATMAWSGGKLKDENPKLYSLAKARCLSADTLVLTNSGYKAIVDVRASDLVWDGGSWVSHGGVQQTGVAPVVPVSGDFFTKEHLLYVGENTTVQAGSVRQGFGPTESFRASVALSGWDEIRFLACAVVRVYSGVGLSLLAVPLRKLRQGVLRLQRQSSERRNDPVWALWECQSARDQDAPNLGASPLKAGIGVVRALGRDHEEVSRSSSPGVPKLWGAWNLCLRGISRRAGLRRLRSYLARLLPGKVNRPD